MVGGASTAAAPIRENERGGGENPTHNGIETKTVHGGQPIRIGRRHMASARICSAWG
jgi:hypothetical protein